MQLLGRTFATFQILAICSALSLAVQQESASYFRKWLDEDVVWIISAEERAVFEKLTTDPEHEQFIEQFWLRRDPTPATFENEFKEEHYRRLAYANEQFTAGLAGWKTDRGMIYIRFGPPDRLETYPAGGTYARERKEGGGMTAIFPTVRWQYRHIEGVGNDVELEFVDDKGGGLFELTFNRQRKDALLHSGRMGLTEDEAERLAATGTTDKRSRISRRGAGEWAASSAAASETMRDKPLQQLELSGALLRAPAVRFPRLHELVTARVSYGALPLQAQHTHFYLTPQQALVSLSVAISDSAIAGQSRIELLGRVVRPSNRIEAVFEEELPTTTFQKRLLLPPGLYKLELAARDVHSGRLGTLQQRLEIPALPAQLALSSIQLARQLEPVGTAADPAVIGDLRVVSASDNRFAASQSAGLYFHVYNFGLNPQTSRPELRVEFAVSPADQEAGQWRDASRSVHYAGSYVRLARMLSLEKLSPGQYRLQVRVFDRITGQIATAATEFEIVPPAILGPRASRAH